ncbi:InlB B-repeat-containing protein [Bifidobacterium xylocopae]|nr:InlB B-repeat-containing protein [Bifidobacterium xylocopae]
MGFLMAFFFHVTPVADEIPEGRQHIFTDWMAKSTYIGTIVVGDDLKVTDLKGIERFQELDTLDMRLQRITDISPLADLPKLKLLLLSGNRISDVKPFAKFKSLPSLSSVRLGSNWIRDATPLVELARAGKFSPDMQIGGTIIASGGRRPSGIDMSNQGSIGYEAYMPNERPLYPEDPAPWGRFPPMLVVPGHNDQALEIPTPLFTLDADSPDANGKYLNCATQPGNGVWNLNSPTTRWEPPLAVTDYTVTCGNNGDGAAANILDGSGNRIGRFGGVVRRKTALGWMVTLHYGDGRADKENRLPQGTRFDKPGDPQRDGYRFQGWSTDQQGQNPYDFSNVVRGNIDLYAQWEPVLTVPYAGSRPVMRWAGEALVFLSVACGLLRGAQKRGGFRRRPEWQRVP